MNELALLAGVMIVGGLVYALPALRERPPPDERDREGAGAGDGGGGGGALRRLPATVSGERLALTLAASQAALVLTRWPVAALTAGAAAAFASSPVLRRGIPEADKAEALTVWAEMLRDATGTPRGIEGVLVATADGAPSLVRPYAQRLAQRLPYEPLESALDDLADDLDHPVGDLVVMALRLAARSGGRQIRAVLDDLASVAREEARMHRRIDVARARPRSDMRAVLVIMLAFVGLFIVTARNYLEPYGTPLGQLVLLCIAGIWASGIWLMARMGRRHQVARFLVRSVDG